MPYLRVPDPSVERAWGFLTPGLKISSNLGTGLKLPFFIPIGRSKDLLLTPFLSPKTKTLELFNNVEIPLVEVLTDMECEGVNLDTKFLKELSKERIVYLDAIL